MSESPKTLFTVSMIMRLARFTPVERLARYARFCLISYKDAALKNPGESTYLMSADAGMLDKE
jgi:hypothetical protein